MCISSTIWRKFECGSLFGVDGALLPSISVTSMLWSSDLALSPPSDMFANDIRSGSSRRNCLVSLLLRGGTIGGGAMELPDETLFKLVDEDELFSEPGRGRVTAYTLPPPPLDDNVLCAEKKWEENNTIKWFDGHRVCLCQSAHLLLLFGIWLCYIW